MNIRSLLFVAFILCASFVQAQKVENIFVNLYTDSLKKGTYNYINIDGKLTNGQYLPLDSTDVIFWSSEGKFYGNTLWIDKNFSKEKIFIKVVLKSNPSLAKEFTMFIKTKADDEKLKTSDEILKELSNKRKGK